MSPQEPEVPAWEVGISGAGVAGALYRLRAEQATGVLVVRDAAQMVCLAVDDGFPVRVDFGRNDLALSDAQHFREWRSRALGGALVGEPLAKRWRTLFAVEEGLARFFAVSLPPIATNLPRDFMGLIRAGLGTEGLDEHAMRRRLESLLSVRERFTLLEPVPAVLAELDALESVLAAHLREGIALVDMLAAAHRFGEGQVTAVLRALYTLSQLGFVRLAPNLDGAVPPTAADLQTGLAQLDIVLARPPALPEGAVLGSIFAKPRVV